MAIRKGEDWGHAAALPDGRPVVHSDGELRRMLSESGGPENLDEIGIVGGDLALTLGSPGRVDRLRTDQAQTVAVDVGRVVLGDDSIHWFVSHLVARRSWWRGRLLLVANSAWMGEWNVAPRAHPGDGRFDVLSTSMPMRQRWQGRQRLAHGGHVPHPEIRTRRVARLEESFMQPLDIWLDGDRVGRSSSIVVELHPEALTIVV